MNETTQVGRTDEWSSVRGEAKEGGPDGGMGLGS